MFISHLAPHVGKDGNDLEVLNDQENNQKFSYINDTDRRQYAGIIYILYAIIQNKRVPIYLQ